MQPPVFPRPLAEKNQTSQKVDDKANSKEKAATSPATVKPFPFDKLPVEIQHMIWAEVVKKPACHSFKIRRADEPTGAEYAGRWEIHLQALPKSYDPSSYRHWKSLFGVKNWSCKTGFDRVTNKLLPIELKQPTTRPKDIRAQYLETAAIDDATDLVIMNFDRGAVRGQSFTWFEHSSNEMMLGAIRERMKQFKRVAIHYKYKHRNSFARGPFQCYCPPPFTLGCDDYKACPHELACFLDCFPNLKEFYFVVAPNNKKEKEWTDLYKDEVSKLGYQVKLPEDQCPRVRFELACFSDMKSRYIQQCPPAFLPKLSSCSPFSAPGGPRRCLVETLRIYKGRTGNEEFRNSLEKRQNVKCGLLIEYKQKGSMSSVADEANGVSDAT